MEPPLTASWGQKSYQKYNRQPWNLEIVHNTNIFIDCDLGIREEPKKSPIGDIFEEFNLNCQINYTLG